MSTLKDHATPAASGIGGIVMDAPHITDPAKRRELWDAYQTTMGSAVVTMGTVGGSMMSALSALFSLHPHLNEEQTWAMVDHDHAQGGQTTAAVAPSCWFMSPSFWYVNQHLGDNFFGFILLHGAQHLLFYDPLHYDELADAVMQRGLLCRQVTGRNPDDSPILGEVYVHHMADKKSAQQTIHQMSNMLMDLVADQRCLEMIKTDALCKVPEDWFKEHLTMVAGGVDKTLSAENHNPLARLDTTHALLDPTLARESEQARDVWWTAVASARGEGAKMPTVQELLVAMTRAMCFVHDPEGQGSGEGEGGSGQGSGNSDALDDGQDGQGGIGDVQGSEPDDDRTPEQKKEGMDRTLNAASQMAGDSPLFGSVRARAVASPRDWTDVLSAALRNQAGGRDKRSMVRPYPPELRRRVVLPTYKAQPKGVALVFIDTSGSVVWGGGPLPRLLGELSGALLSGRITQAHVVPCDTQVHEVIVLDADKMRDAADPLGQANQDLIGGGGTSFAPPFEWLEGQEAQAIAPAGGYTACLYLTDGYGEPPSVSLVNRVAPKFGGVGSLFWLLPHDDDTVTRALRGNRGLGRGLRVR